MSSFTDTIVWAVAMLAFIIVEAATPQLVSIWFAAGALTAAVCSVFIPSISVQLLIFLAVSALCLFLTKPLAGRVAEVKKSPTNADMVIGQKAVIIEDTNPATGTARAVIMGETWSCVSVDGQDLTVGQSVKVHKIRGVKLIVEAAEDKE